MTSNECIAAKNTLGWSAVASCAIALLLLCVYLHLLLCHYDIVHLHLFVNIVNSQFCFSNNLQNQGRTLGEGGLPGCRPPTHPIPEI
jgi:hypothetical protein